jgi:hypothetical protein
MTDDRWDAVAVPILEFVRRHTDEMGWVSFRAIEAGTGLSQEQIVDEVERLCTIGLFDCRLRWCVPGRSWSM